MTQQELKRNKMDKQSTPMSSVNVTSNGRIFFIVMLILAVTGIGVSIELTNIHHATHTDPNFVSVCAVSDEVNCETVARSPYSVFLGAPVSVWGIFGYLLISFFAVWGLKRQRWHDRFPVGILTFLVSAALTAAGILAFISFTRIDSLCLFCMTLYGINTIMSVIVVSYLIHARINPCGALIADIVAFFRKPAILAAIAVPVIAAAAGVILGITPYWQHVGWREIPKLKTGVDENGFHWTGAENPILTVVEYSDYQCPFCRKAHKDLRLLAAEYPDEVRLIHRHMPLDNACNAEIERPFHEYACKFSKAAECAGEQHMFWAMNDALFSIQDTMKAGDVDVEILAVELGLDRSSFKECMARPGVPPKMKKDMAAAAKLEIKGTPTFFVGAQSYEGRIPEAVFRKLVENARKASGKAPEKAE